ncbi:hypothetical protein ABFS83_14G134300 [Erythranthe nasuta]
MRSVQDQSDAQETKPTNLVTHDSQNVLPNNANETPVPDSGSISASSNDNKKVSREDIQLVQNLIERCLQLYMNRDEVVKTLLNRASIDPGFTSLVWQKLEEENADFFRAYYIRLKLKKQIILFNHLLEHQYHVMKFQPPPKVVPMAPIIQNGFHPMPVNNLPMGYPVTQQFPIPATLQHHMNIDPMYHVANGVPAPANFFPMRNDMAMDTCRADVAPNNIMPQNNAISSMPASPASMASSGHFAFSASEMSGMAVDSSALDTAFTSDVASSVGLDLHADNGAGNSGDSPRSLAEIPWNFSFSDLTADLSNLGDLGALQSYPGSPLLLSDTDILLDSPEHDGLVEEFLVDSDSVPGQCPPLDEEKPLA